MIITITRSPAVAEIADHTVLEILRSLRAQGVCRGLKVVVSVFLERHSLFTCSGTFAVGCNV